MTGAEESENTLKSSEWQCSHALEPQNSSLHRTFSNEIGSIGVEDCTKENVSSEQKHGLTRRGLKRKSKRRHESLLASICQLIVQHQIGRGAHRLMDRNCLLTFSFRTCCEPPDVAYLDASLLSTSPSADSKILPTFIP